MLVKQSQQRAEEMARVNSLLRDEAPDWDEVSRLVEQVSDTVRSTTPTEQGHIEPYLYRTVYDALLALWPAVQRRDRRHARLAAEAVRQALVDIADAVERDGPLDPKQTARWIDRTVGDLDEHAVAVLFDVSHRTWRRWLTEGEATPTGAAAARLRTVAAALDHLHRAYTSAGAIAWFERAHPHLDHERPADLLGQPDQHRTIIDTAAGARVSSAA